MRSWTWHRYRVYIDFQALQVSLLGGRVFFKGLRYHGNNETILIHSGYVTWCYWRRNVKELDLGINGTQRPRDTALGPQTTTGYSDPAADEKRAREDLEGPTNSKKLSHRLNITLSGAEWFVYNRSAAYDAVLTGILGDAVDVESIFKNPAEAQATTTKKNGMTSSSEVLEKRSSLNKLHRRNDVDEHGLDDDIESRSQNYEHSSASTSGTEDLPRDSHNPSDLDKNLLLRFLPLHIECSKAAVVLGNENTKCVLITKVDRVSSEIDASRCSSLDQYKQLIKLNFDHPIIQIKPNDDYKEDQTAAASRIKSGIAEQPEPKVLHVHTKSFFHRQRRKAWYQLQRLVPYFRSSVESVSSSLNNHAGAAAPPGVNGWQGLPRYLDEGEQDDKAKWSGIEYATVSTIVDSPEANMLIYWDVPGVVPVATDVLESKPGHETRNINGQRSPEWGINLSFKGGTINYGPWADRQRADLQKVFFPSVCRDAVPAKKLSAGQIRMPTEFKLYIEFEEEITLRIPVREESKNWRWMKQTDQTDIRQSDAKTSGRSRKRKAEKTNSGPEIRPFGWLDIRVAANAAVVYSMDMVAGDSGFSNKLELDLPSTEITTSVNHGVLWRSTHNRIDCDLSAPLQWNGLRTWEFDVQSNELELFLLREHIFLLIDLVDDWASGPPPDYLTFTPFRYSVNILLDDFKLYLNVNDSNIINNPSDFDDNTFLIIFGASLAADVQIPLDTYRPHRNTVSFTTALQHGGLGLQVPPWNTQATFLKSTEVARLKALALDGSYQYCSSSSPSNTDILFLNIQGRAPMLQLYGFLIRYFLKIKDNYFGEDVHFKTLEEYQEVLRTRGDGQLDNSNIQPHKISNDLDVILGISAYEASIVLPGNLYSAKQNICIEIPEFTTDLRFTNYFMELETVFSTLSFSQGLEDEDNMSTTSNTQLFVDGLSVSGNRLFGLPPTEPTYVCNWDFDVGSITGEITSGFLHELVLGGRCFAFSFDDDENALPSIKEAILHDVTFLRASISSIEIWLHVEEATFMFSTQKISLTFNDWAGSHYSKKLLLQLPNLRMACIDAESASRHRTRNQDAVETHAFISSGLSMAMITRKPSFKTDRELQQEHIQRHDQRTHRADFLLHQYLPQKDFPDIIDEPAMHVPPIPLPLHREYSSRNVTSSIKSSLQSRRGRLKHKSSFISSDSSRSFGSIIRSHDSGGLKEQLDTAREYKNSYTNGGTYQPIPRNLSTSTGHRSSFYSAVGESKGSHPSRVTLSSPFIAPYFPLQGIEPTIVDIPPLPHDFDKDLNSNLESITLADIRQDPVDENVSHSSLILELPVGISAFFTPKSVQAVASLLSSLQPMDPTDILDDLQMDAVNNVFDMEKEKNTNGKVGDISIRSPGISLRFLHPSKLDEDTLPSDHVMIDQYDLSISGLSITTRSERKGPELGGDTPQRNSSTLHVKLSSASIAAKERFNNTDDPHAAIRCLIQDVIFWVNAGESTLADITFKFVEAAAISRQVEYLTSLLHRTNKLISGIDDLFSSLTAEQCKRVQLFTYIVATTAQQAADPLFLTRPSYVLRSARDHLRTTDSWKVVTRLHHMYDSLAPSTQQEIAMRCLENTESLPKDAQQRVITGFDQWRSWDLNNLETCPAMAKVYGAKDDNSVDELKLKSVRIALRTKLFRVILDPGPKQNEISLSDLSFLLEVKPIKQRHSVEHEGYRQDAQFTNLEIFSSDILVKLNWELYDLVPNLLNLYHQESSAKNSPNYHIVKEPYPAVSKPKTNFQIVVGTGNGTIIFDTINIRAVLTSQGLKTSFLISDLENKGTKNMSLLIAADAASSKVRSRSQELTEFQLRYPSIYTSFEPKALGSVHQNNVKLAANCQQLSFNVRQDIQALIEMFDIIIRDELAQIEQLRRSLPTPGSRDLALSPQIHSAQPTYRFDVSLFLDMYHITIPLLHSLTYTISGVVARASIESDPESDVIFDFDIKENAHNFLSIVGNKLQSISLLQLPATNGRLTTHSTMDKTVVSVFASVEPIEFDASAIHGLLAALNRPETSSVIADVKEDISTIRLHIEDIYGTSDAPNSKKSKDLVYDTHLTLAGLSVSANADTAEQQGTAKFTFNLGTMQFIAANRPEEAGPILEFPEVRVGLRNITVDLSRSTEGGMESCGNITFAAFLNATLKKNEAGDEVQYYHLRSDGLEINLFAETAPTIIDVIGHLQNKIKDVDLSREKQYLRKLRKPIPRLSSPEGQRDANNDVPSSTAMFSYMYSLELLRIQVSWLIGAPKKDQSVDTEEQDLVFSLRRIELTKRKANSARLTIEDLQLQMVPAFAEKSERSLNSALLPEIIFNVGYVASADARRFAFQAAGKSLDLRLTSRFVIPAVKLRRSIGSAVDKVRLATTKWSTNTTRTTSDKRPEPFFGTKRVEALLIDADFAGAIVHLSGKKMANSSAADQGVIAGSIGKYGGPKGSESSDNTILRSPGLAWKVEYRDNKVDDPSLNAEIKVDASSNVLYPSVVPLISEIASTIKEVVSEGDGLERPSPIRPPQKPKLSEEDSILTADPSAMLGRTRLNLGIRICRQEFGLSCQPIARVAATARFEDIYLTINTVRSVEHGNFFAVSGSFTKLQASVQHVYSRESTGSFEVESIFLSLLNSKHVSGISGVSAILKVSPVKVLINAKQLQDFLLFREIWVPPDAPESTEPFRPPPLKAQSSSILVQRYQEVAVTGAFPWNATVSIDALDVQLDLGPSIGKPSFNISNFWMSSKKTSDWEQNLCVGFDKIGVDSTGRMSGFVSLQGFKIRTSIQWPVREKALNKTPLVQASLGFIQLRAKISFDYQAFLVADITSFDFLMYNVHNDPGAKYDRLVAVLDGDAVRVFCTTTSAAQGLALYQAFLRLIQEKKSNYQSSLAEIGRFLQRKSSMQSSISDIKKSNSAAENTIADSPITLNTNVIVTLKALYLGAFPSTFSDHQVFKLEALNAQARFAAAMDEGKIHSILGLTLGQLRIGLAGVKSSNLPKSVGDVSVEDVVNAATGSRGGTILKVPRLQALMETWQEPRSTHIDYIFKSFFEGKVEVGWNYSRISYIRSMWAAHSKALAQILGKPLPPSAVKITGVPDDEERDDTNGERPKITAEVNVPQSKYDYTALVPPIIETPQLRDMGEATPPLEWIGLSPQKLPDLTHQIIIVTLLELVTEVEDAYAKILGSS